MADTTKTINVRYNIEQGSAVSSSEALRESLKKVNNELNSAANQMESVGKSLGKDLNKAGTSAKNVASGVTGVGEAAKKSKSDMDKFGDSLLKKFFGIEAAMKAIRAGIQFVSEGLKDFSRITGDDTLNQLSKKFNQLRLDIASALMPVLRQFNEWWNDNSATITRWGLKFAGVIKGTISVVSGYVKVIKNEIEVLFDGILAIATAGLAKIVSFASSVASKVPGLSKEIKDGLKDSADYLQNFSRAAKDNLVNDTKEGIEGVKQIASGFAEIYKSIANDPKKSGVKFISEEETKKIKEYTDLLRALRAEYANVGSSDYVKNLNEINKAYEKLFFLDCRLNLSIKRFFD